MKRYGSRSLGLRVRAAVTVVALLGLAWGLTYKLNAGHFGAAGPALQDNIPNNHSERNPGGVAATFSAHGAVNLTGEYFPQRPSPSSCRWCAPSSST